MWQRLVSTSALILVAGSACALSVDFEGSWASDPFSLGKQYTGFAGITLTTTNDSEMRIIGVGGPGDAFSHATDHTKDDTPYPFWENPFGDWFLSGDGVGNDDLKMTFDTPMKGVRFDIADIDGMRRDPFDETFEVNYLLGGTIVDTQIVKGSTAAIWEGRITQFSYLGMVDEVTILGTTAAETASPGSWDMGWGLDNIEAGIVPLPGSAVLLLGGVGAFVALRRIRERAHPA